MALQKVYLFAPENDIALASGKRYYTPPPASRKIAADLALLPLWYADEESIVLSQRPPSDELQQTIERLGITSRTAPALPPGEWECCPWGWSAYTCQQLEKAGIESRQLPDDKQITEIRRLSGRATTRDILQRFAELIPDYPLPPIPEILYDAASTERFATSHRATLLKAPWSSSGRGIIRVNGLYDTSTARQAEGILRKQGYIMGEVLLDKTADLAFEFYSNGIQTRFAGYSLFNTDRRGSYIGNILAPDTAIERYLSRSISPATLHATQAALQHITTELIAPHYKGYFGIDAIIYRDDDTALRLYPCIELNLRMNMGLVAHCIASRFMAEGSSGSYHVAYAPSPAQHIERHRTMYAQYPPVIEGRHIISGYLPLTPLYNDTLYHAYIIVERKNFL